VFFLEWFADYLVQQGVRNAEIWQALRAELWRCRHPALDGLRERGRRGVRAVVAELRGRAQRRVPAPWRWWLAARLSGQTDAPPIGWVRFGDLRRLTPLSRQFGFERGLPVDRFYIERFLSAHAADIKGDVLEVEDDTYTRRFGGGAVTRVEILHVTGTDKATIVADLRSAEHIPSASFDCVILTQTLQFIFEVPAALATVYRILRHGGVVLATLPGISQISRYDRDRWGHFWSFTSQSARRLFEGVFPPAAITVEAHGNVLAATAFLYGVASQELRGRELDYTDPDYEVIITIRAVKPLPEP
jgi:SAM-dependent methyltransferase